MKITLKQYQKKAVNNIIDKSYSFLSKNDEIKRVITFQAPTGSGKTIIMASAIEGLIEKNKESDFEITFLWLSIGTGELHYQSKKSLEKNFVGYPKVQIIDEVYSTSQTELLKDTVMVVSWQKIWSKDRSNGDWKSIVMKDGDYINFRDMLNNTKSINRKIVLIIDETSAVAKGDSVGEIKDLIGANVLVEVSATPVYRPTGLDIVEEKAWYEKVEPQSVIDEEMIKDQILINYDFNFKEGDDTDVAILKTAIEKRSDLKRLYEENGIDVNPLLLIQLPNSENGEVVKQTVLEVLKNQTGVVEGDDRLSIWLDDQKFRNLENISDNNGVQEYLIFKQAVAIGWDCPRAQVLIKFREGQSESFNIQVLGRILRMPEQKHYEIENLNKSYVYTNTLTAKFDIEQYSPKILGDLPSYRSPIYNKLNLKSFYKERADYQDIKGDFKKVLFEQFEKELNLTLEDYEENILNLKKIKTNIANDLGWQFDIDVLLYQVIKDMTVEYGLIDTIGEFTDNDNLTQSLIANDRHIEFLSKDLFKKMMSPFTNIARSVPTMNVAWHLLCKNYFGEKITKKGLKGSQAFLIANYSKIYPIFKRSVERYSEIKETKAQEDIERFDFNFEILEKDYFNKEIIERLDSYKKHLLQPCYLYKDRSSHEKKFEEYLESRNDISWWYKNGEARKDYFGIKYIYENEVHTFYPDYLIQFEDDITGIYEIKDENDIEKTTKSKSKNEALQTYIKEESNSVRKLDGGVVYIKNNEWRIIRDDDSEFL